MENQLNVAQSQSTENKTIGQKDMTDYTFAILLADNAAEVMRLSVEMHCLAEESNKGTHLEGNVSKEVLRKEGEILGEMFLEMRRMRKKNGLGNS